MFHRNIKDKILEFISNFVCKYPYPVLVISILLALLSVHYTIQNLKFLTNRNDLISPHEKYYKDYQEFRKEFKDFDGLVIAVEGSNKEKVKDFVEDLVHFFNSHPENYTKIFYKIDTDFFKNRKLLFLNLNDLHSLKDKIKSNKAFIHGLIEEPGLESFFFSVNKEISKAMTSSLISDFIGGNEKSSKKESEDPFDLSLVESIMEQMVFYLKGEKNYSSPWQNIFIKKKGEIDEEGYLTSKGRKFYFIFVNPVENQADFARAVNPIKTARNYIKKLQLKYPGITAGVTGPTALSSDEMITTKNDTVKASFISLIGVTILLVTSLKGFTLPFTAVFTLVIALCWSLGFTTLTIGHLSILSVVFTTILIGLGIDFGIHFIMRYQEEKEYGKNIKESISSSIIRTGKGVIAGAITTSFAFMTTVFTDFKGIAELGFIAGTGILICLVATITVLPALVIITQQLQDKRWIKKLFIKSAFDYNISKKAIHPVYDVLLKKPKYIIIFGLIVTFLSILVLKDIRFDYNLLNLQASGLESVDYEMKILNNSGKSAWYGAIVVNTFNKVLSTKKSLESLPSVNTVSSIASLVPDKQEEKIAIIKKITQIYNIFLPVKINTDSVDLAKLTKVLKKIHFKMRKGDEDSWEPGKKPRTKSIQKVRKLITDFNVLVKERGEKIVQKSLDQYQNILFFDFVEKLQSFRDALNPLKVKISDIPSDLKERYIGKTGKFLLQISPKMNIYDREPMEEFISDIMSVDPNATGTAVTASESSRLMKEGYVRGGVYALAAIIIFVWISFKDWRCVLLAVLPLVLGSFWTLGIMGLFNLQFNLANLIILPLIIGIGVDNGIHIVHRYRDDIDSAVSPVYKSTGKAVMLSSFTTMIGFGSLMLASHRGIHSIGVLLTIGVGCCMIASLTVLPAILKIACDKGWKPKKA